MISQLLHSICGNIDLSLLVSNKILFGNRMTFIFDCQTSCWPWIDEALDHRNAVVNMCLHKSGLIVLLFWGNKQQTNRAARQG